MLRILGFTLIMVVLVILVRLALDWFGLTSSSASSEAEIAFVPTQEVFEGKVIQVDPTGGMLSLEEPGGQSQVLSFAGSLAVSMKGSSCGVQALHAGERVKAWCGRDHGKLQARKIEVMAEVGAPPRSKG